MDVKKELQKLADAIKEEILRRFNSPLGVNAKTGVNTLKDSNLLKSVDVKVTSTEELSFVIADYYTYIVGGRKPGWGTPPPTGFVEGVTRWVREKGIRFEGKTETQTIWMCIRSIVKNGIKGRAVLGNGFINDDPAYVLPFLNDFFDKWADDVFEEITKEINKRF